MNAGNSNTRAARFEDRALSDSELAAVSGGERQLVTKEQYEAILAERIKEQQQKEIRKIICAS